VKTSKKSVVTSRITLPLALLASLLLVFSITAHACTCDSAGNFVDEIRVAKLANADIHRDAQVPPIGPSP